MGDSVRGALIGCGFFAENHLNAWRDLGANIVAVCDIDLGKAESAASRHKIARAYSDANEMLRTEKPDFVDIVTTVPSHRMLVELAAKNGVGAICQKPFATNLADADAMIAACEDGEGGSTFESSANFIRRGKKKGPQIDETFTVREIASRAFYQLPGHA